MKVVILAGGYGTRFGKLTDFLPKPMIPVGPYPILWHIMRYYAHHGFNDFIFCLGYKADLIKEYFTHFEIHHHDFTMDFSKPRNLQRTFHISDGNGFLPRVTLAYTGLHTMTGGRIKRIAKYLDGDEDFMLTYGDGLTNLNLHKLIEFHRSHGKIATLTAVHPPPKFGDLRMEGERVAAFSEKELRQGGFINGGFYIFKKKILDYLENDTTCVLEKRPLETLAEEGQLMAYKYDGFWQCMDTTRDMELLNDYWYQRQAPWKLWDEPYVD